MYLEDLHLPIQFYQLDFIEFFTPAQKLPSRQSQQTIPEGFR